MAVALSRVRAKLWSSYACRASLATTAAGWPAAGYGALVIWAAGDFDRTGSAWIFGWPFIGLLALATVAAQLILGIGTAFGLPAAFSDARVLNRVLTADGAVRTADPVDLAAGVRAIARFPVTNATMAAALSVAVIVGTELIELAVVGPGSPNFAVIARGGVLATVLYVSTGITLNEHLVWQACCALRRAALGAGLPIDDAGVVARPLRLLTAVVPSLTALAAAVEMGTSQHVNAMAYGALIILSAVVAIGVTWLHVETQERTTHEIAAACRALAEGEESQLVTGSIDGAHVAMALEFNAAAVRVRAHRRASAERYRALFDGAGDAILLVEPTSGLVTEASTRAERLFGMPRQELVGRAFADCVDRATAERLGEFALTERGAAELALVNAGIVRRDGTRIPVDVSIATIDTGESRVLQAIARDVRDRVRIEGELRKAARRFEELYRVAVVLGDDPRALADHTVRALTSLLECPSASVAVLEDGGTRLLALHSPSGGAVPDRRPLVGSPCAEVHARAEPCAFTDVATRFASDTSLAAAGIRTYLGAPILDGAGAVIGVVSVLDVRDRTFRDDDVQLLASFAQRIGGALERERYGAERTALMARLVESDRVRTEFLGMMSHELRTPLNILIGYTRMLLEGVEDGDAMAPRERGGILERMLAGGLHLGDLVEDTLAVLRLEAGVAQIDAGAVELPEFFEQLQSVDRLLRRPSDVVERWSVDPDVPVVVTDRRKLRQVVTNLVGNARKFTDRGTIEVRASRSPAGGVRIAVRDTGCGIDRAHLGTVFDLYRQAPTAKRHDGCGLGLYIVRRYVELVGGTVTCESALGVGTTFVVDLPAAIATAAAAA